MPVSRHIPESPESSESKDLVQQVRATWDAGVHFLHGVYRMKGSPQALGFGGVGWGSGYLQAL